MLYFEDFETGLKTTTRGRTITETDIVTFAMWTGDWYPVHTDVEYAKNSLFGERIAHGFLVLSAASGLMPLYDIAIVAFYGMDKVRFMQPTKIGDTIRVVMEPVKLTDKGEIGGVVTILCNIINQRDEDVAKITLKVLVMKKPVE